MSTATGQERRGEGRGKQGGSALLQQVSPLEDSPFELRLKRRRSRVRLGSAGKSALG